MPAESALVVLIPAADDLVAAFRREVDPAAAPGLPAHVTLLYPFLAPAELNPFQLSALQALFAPFPSFDVSFAETGQFPGVLYLAPAPAEPFLQLTEAIARRFPETPPYGGEFAEIHPHLTIALAGDPQQLAEMAARFQQAAANRLPIQARVETVALLDNSSGVWQVLTQFLLGPGASAGD